MTNKSTYITFKWTNILLYLILSKSFGLKNLNYMSANMYLI